MSDIKYNKRIIVTIIFDEKDFSKVLRSMNLPIL